MFPTMEVFHLLTSKLILNKNTTFLLKNLFTSNILTLLLARKQLSIYGTPWDILDYNHNSRILLMFEKIVSLDLIFHSMILRDFPNVLAVEYSTFEEIPIIYSFDIIRKNVCINTEINDVCSLKSSRIIPKIHETFYNHFKNNFYHDKLKSLNSSSITFAFSNEFPRTQAYSSTEIFGYFGNIFRAYCESKNATLKTIINKYTSSKNLNLLNKLTFVDFTNLYKSFEYGQNKILNVFLMSTVLELLLWIVIVPEPSPIKTYRYIFKPFDTYIWLTTLTSIFLISFLSKGSFSRNFCDYLRAVLSSSYDFNSKIRITKMHFLFVIYGFILTTLYNSFIGSFLTTILFEKPLNTLDDIKSSGFKVLVNNRDNFLSYPKLQKYEDVFKNVSSAEFFNDANKMNDNYAFIAYGDQWEYYFKPRMEYLNRKIFLETKIIINYYPIYLEIKKDSIFRNSFNRFLHYVRDSGLYSRWTKGAFSEALQFKIKSKNRNIEDKGSYKTFEFADSLNFENHEKIRPINLTNTKYCFYFYFLGFFSAVIIFIIELFKRKFKFV